MPSVANTPSSRKPWNSVSARPMKPATVVSAASTSEPRSSRAIFQAEVPGGARLHRFSTCTG